MLLAALSLSLLVPAHHPTLRLEGHIGVDWNCGPTYDNQRTWLTTDDGRIMQIHAVEAIAHNLGPLHRLAGERVIIEGEEEATGVLYATRASAQKIRPRNPAPAAAPAVVSKPFITALVSFSDTTVQPPHAASWYSGLFNPSGPSLPDYFQKQSYGAIDLSGSVLMTQWIKLAHPK